MNDRKANRSHARIVVECYFELKRSENPEKVFAHYGRKTANEAVQMLKIGMKVVVLDYDFYKRKNLFKEGEIIAYSVTDDNRVLYAVRFEDDTIDTFTKSNIFVKWKK